EASEFGHLGDGRHVIGKLLAHTEHERRYLDGELERMDEGHPMTKALHKFAMHHTQSRKDHLHQLVRKHCAGEDADDLMEKFTSDMDGGDVETGEAALVNQGRVPRTKNHMEQRISRIIEDHNNFIHIAELGRMTGTSPAMLHDMLQRMRRAGIVT